MMNIENLGFGVKKYSDFRKSIVKKQALIAMMGCLVIITCSIYYLSRCYLFHNIHFITQKHLTAIYLPIGIYAICSFVILLIIRSKEKYWKIAEFITYISVCILPYWGLQVMMISVIEGRKTNFLIWVIGMMTSSAVICVLPHIAVVNQIAVTVASWLACQYYSVQFGESQSLNVILYGLLCVWAAYHRFHNEYGEFRVNQELKEAMEKATQSKEEADKANAAKSTFLAHMSHEIRTPINTIMGMDELILRESENDQVQEYADNIKSSGNMLMSLINDILDFSKIEAGKMEILPLRYYLSSTLTDLINMINMRAKNKGLDIKLFVNEKIPLELYGDEIRVKQIVANLLTNAVKYTKEGSITFSVDYKMLENDMIDLIFSVRDTGIGIKAEDMDKLFNSFQRLDESQNRSIEGTGLGLTIASQLLGLMKGKMSIESHYGSGSCFTAHIPQKVEGKETIGLFENRFDKNKCNKKAYKCLFTAPDAKILIVDDNTTNRVLAKALLQGNLVQVDLAEGGEQMLSMVKNGGYDMIFLDHRMPDMDGIEALHLMKERNLCPNVPVVALTANVMAGARNFYIGEGFQDFLSKPIDPVKYEKLLYQYLPSEKVTLTNPDEVNGSDVVPFHKKDAEIVKSKPVLGQINIEAGQEWCGNDSKIYREVLKSFLDTAETKIEVIKSCLAEKDIKRFTIEIHSVKSSSRTIGAEKTAEMAEDMELMGKLFKQDEITNIMEKFWPEYEALLENIRSLLEKEDFSK